MDYSQVGRAGELALTLAALVTSDGQVELFAAVVDDDHVDLVASVRGGLPTPAIQVKTGAHLAGVEIAACWLVPSPDFIPS